MAEAAPAQAPTATSPVAKAPAAAQPEPSFWVALTDIRLRIGNSLVTKRAGTILHPVADAYLINHIIEAYKNAPPLPIRRLSERDYEMLIIRGRM